MHSRRPARNALVAMLVALLIGAAASTSLATSVSPVASHQGVAIGNTADYEWWYGCAPTAAGMVMGHYDRNGYGGLDYGNLLPGAVAESSTFGNPDALANSIIASEGHITDFYRNGYMALGDDVYAGRPFDCLADFMGTSQDAFGYINASTAFYSYTEGYALPVGDIVYWDLQDESGMYGIYEYLRYRGYASGDPAEDVSIYNQRIAGYAGTLPGEGFTFDDYMAQIDAGRPVMIHVDGHTMFGYGYEVASSEIILHDTWSPGEHRMTWGGSYPYVTGPLAHFGVTVIEVTPGAANAPPIPEPLTMLALLGGVMGVSAYLRKRRGNNALN